jgi:hypothetical protein
VIGFGSLLTLFGAWGLYVHFAGLHPGIRGPAHEPYSTVWIGWTGGAVFVAGIVTLARGLRDRRRQFAARDAARMKRHARLPRI